MRPSRSTLLLLVGAALVMAMLPASGAAQEADVDVPAKPGRVSSILADLEQAAGGRGADTALARAAELGIPVSGEAIQVEVTAMSWSAADAAAAIEAAGGTVEETYGSHVAGFVPITALHLLEQNEAVRWVAPIPIPYPEAIAGEGPGFMDADRWHDAGFTGKGVTVAIIDGGFTGLSTYQASGDVPPTGILTDPGAQVKKKDLCGGQFNTGSVHGTAVAEVLHETAPDADLLLICIETSADFGKALNFAEANGANIVSVSLGFFNTGRGDGTGSLQEWANKARNKGMLWINSNGNYAQTHWKGPFTDANSDTWHDTTWSFYLDGTAIVYLKWDDWPASDCDLDLWVCQTSDCSHTGDPLDWSENYQNGTQPPVEETLPFSGAGTLYVRVFAFGGLCTSTPRMDLFVPSGTLSISPSVKGGSVTGIVPNPKIHSVGAVWWGDGVVEPFSSRGPTIDGRIVPDTSAPDGVSNGTYGLPPMAGFYGTSAAAPHVAGVAALISQAWPGLTPVELDAKLKHYTRDGGVAGTDKAYGVGIIDLGAPPVLAQCFGKNPTFTGSYGDDIITGTPDQDVILGLGGNDQIDGMAGNDLLCGGDGNDLLVGGDGHDKLSGGAGLDRLFGYDGRDQLFGDGGNDKLRGGKDRDRMWGGLGKDLLAGAGGNDDLSGQGGDDRLFGQLGADLLVGGAGIDTGDGGPGFDTCNVETPIACE